MPTAKKYKSLAAAKETLKRFYANAPDSDSLSTEEIFAAAGRLKHSKQANLAWLSNKITTLRYHNLVDANYSYDGRRRLEGLTLTLDGKRALGRAGTVGTPGGTLVTPQGLTDVLALVSQLRKDYPDFDIALTVKPKDK